MKPKFLGLTGNIGAGKTTVADIIQNQFGIPVIKSDEVAEQVVLRGHLREDIERILGPGIYLPQTDKTLCWKRVREATFASQEAECAFRTFLGSVVWDAVQEIAASMPDHPYICVESALLYEVGWDQHCSVVLCVWCDQGDAIHRLMKYRGECHDSAQVPNASY